MEDDIICYYTLLAMQSPGKCVYHGPSTLPAPHQHQDDRAANPATHPPDMQHRQHAVVSE
jgi:hypothetical protein